MNKAIIKLMEGNQAFIKQTLEKDESFFKKLSTIQNPEYLWIGCSDSRIPADKITNQMPGTIFVHRNIANQINPLDFNVLSVIYYSLYYLKIQNVIICGHYNCGGILASILIAKKKEKYGFLENWLLPIKELYISKKETFKHFQENDLETSSKELSELNVLRQMEIFEELILVKQFLKNTNQMVNLFGMIYDVKDGRLKLLKEKTLKYED